MALRGAIRHFEKDGREMGDLAKLTLAEVLHKPCRALGDGGHWRSRRAGKVLSTMKFLYFQRIARTAALLAAAANPLAASACPLCNTPTGQQVRAGIFDHDFGMTLLTVLAPFPVLLLVLAMMHFGLPRFGKVIPTASAEIKPRTDTSR